MRQYERGPANPTPRKCDWLSQPALELNQDQKATFWKRIGDLVGYISYLGDSKDLESRVDRLVLHRRCHDPHGASDRSRWSGGRI